MRWKRLEGLLDEAKGSSGYDVSAALGLLADYLISDEGDDVLNDLADSIVYEADSLGMDGISYLFKAIGSLSINDDISALNAFRSLKAVFNQEKHLDEKVQSELPEPTESMIRFRKVLYLWDTTTGSDEENTIEYSKFIPIFRKLATNHKIQRTLNEITARLGERALSRSLRAVFGLPPPAFYRPFREMTVFEENMT